MRALATLLAFSVAAALPAAAQEEDSHMLEPGEPFPAFSLPADDGTTVSSANLEGEPYLIYFYPKADTPGCTKEACTLRDRWEDVKAAGFKVFGVSYDSPKANHAFAEKYNLPFPLLSDEDHDLAEQVGAARMLIPVPKRISYLVGPDGTVLKAYPDVKPAEHAGEVLADYQALQTD